MDTVPRTQTALLVLLVLGAAAGSFCLELPYQLDDFTVIPHGIRGLEQIGGGLDALFSGRPLDNPPGNYLFRPLPWATYALEVTLVKGQANATFSHGVSLVLHLLTVLLVYGFGCRWSKRAGLIGAAIFAVHPAGAQAVSWVAARGDLTLALAGVPAVMFALNARRTNRGSIALLAGIFAAAMLASKATAFAYLPLVFAPLLVGPEDADRLRPRLVIIGLLPVIPVFVIRWWFLGSMAPVYDGGVAFSFSALPRMADGLVPLIRYILVPWNNHPDAVAYAEPMVHRILPSGSWLAPQDMAALSIATLPGAALVAAPRRFGRVLLRVFPVLAILLFPPLFLFTENSAAAAARTLYAPMVAVTLVLGMALAVLFERGVKSVRGVVAVPLALVATFIILDAHIHLRRLELHAGELVTRRLVAIDEAYRGTPNDFAVVLLDGHSDFAGIPLIGAVAGAAVAWPFRNPERVLYAARSEDALLASEVMVEYPGPARVLRCVDHRVEVVADVPAMRDPFPGLRRVGEPGVWLPKGPVAPRAVAGIQLTSSPGKPQTLSLEIISDRHLVRGLVTLGEGVTTLTLGVPQSFEWVTGAILSRVVLRPADDLSGEARIGKSPELMAKLPLLRQESPSEGARVPLDLVPEFQVRDVPAGAALRLSVLLRYQGFELSMIHEIASEDQERLDGGLVAVRPFRRHRVDATMPDLFWESLAPKFRAHLNNLGVRAVKSLIDVTWTAEALTPDGRWVSARSGRGRFSLVP